MSHAILQPSQVFTATSAGWFVAGALLGFLHFRTLRWSVRCMLDGRALHAFVLQVLRFAATGTALTLVVRGFGAVPLLAGALGLLAARSGMLLLERQR